MPYKSIVSSHRLMCWQMGRKIWLLGDQSHQHLSFIPPHTYPPHQPRNSLMLIKSIKYKKRRLKCQCIRPASIYQHHKDFFQEYTTTVKENKRAFYSIIIANRTSPHKEQANKPRLCYLNTGLEHRFTIKSSHSTLQKESTELELKLRQNPLFYINWYSPFCYPIPDTEA